MHPVELKLRAREMRLQGLPVRAIAAELGTGKTTIERWCTPPRIGREATPPTPRTPLGDPFPQLLERLTPPFRAAARTFAAAIVAGHFGSPQFVCVYGEPASCKTLLGQLVVRCFGWDPAEVLVQLDQLPPSGLIGRTSGRGGRYHLERSAWLDQPVLILDELQQARAGIRQQVHSLINGAGRLSGEGGTIAARPSCLVTFNTRPLQGSMDAVFPLNIKRRVFGFDTRRAEIPDPRPLVELLAALPRQAMPGRALTRLDVQSLDPELRALLSPTGYQLLHHRGLEPLLEAYAALWGEEDASGLLLADQAALAATRGDLAGTETLARRPGVLGRPELSEAAIVARIAAIRRVSRLLSELRSDDTDQLAARGERVIERLEEAESEQEIAELLPVAGRWCDEVTAALEGERDRRAIGGEIPRYRVVPRPDAGIFGSTWAGYLRSR